MKRHHDFEGADSLIRKLEGMDEEIREKAAKEALLAGAEPIKKAWKQNVNVRTGDYREGIHTEYDKQEEAAIIKVDLDNKIPYPWWQEFGTSKMAAHPALRPAVDEHKDEAFEAMAEVLQDTIGNYTK